MLFSNKLSKFGKGKNLSAIMDSKDKISIYFFEKGISKKEVYVNENNMLLKRVSVNLGYNEVVPITPHLLATRIDNVIGIISYEK